MPYKQPYKEKLRKGTNKIRKKSKKSKKIRKSKKK